MIKNKINFLKDLEKDIDNFFSMGICNIFRVKQFFVKRNFRMCKKIFQNYNRMLKNLNEVILIHFENAYGFHESLFFDR